MQNDNKVYFKATKDSLIVMLDPDAGFVELKEALYAKALYARKFFGSTVTAISFKGRKLSKAEERVLAKIIEEATDLKVIVIEASRPNTISLAPKTTGSRRYNGASKANGYAPVLNTLTASEPSARSGRAFNPLAMLQKEKLNESEKGNNAIMEKIAASMGINNPSVPEALNTSQNRYVENYHPPRRANAAENYSPQNQGQQNNADDEAPQQYDSLEDAELPISPEVAWPNSPENTGSIRSRSSYATEGAVFYRGSLRSGMCVESKGSVVILGDVNPGGEVIAGGNIVVLGILKGLAHAGVYGDKTAFVAAISLQPVQLRIANIITSVAEELTKRGDHQPDPSYAYIHDEQIYIAPLI